VRIASFNAENLFERAMALSDRNWEKGRPALEAYTRINTLLNQSVYTQADRSEICRLLRKLGLGKKDDGGVFAQLRQNRGRLVVRRKVGHGTRLDIVANDRADWVGWVELKMGGLVRLPFNSTGVPVYRASGRCLLLRVNERTQLRSWRRESVRSASAGAVAGAGGR
jgi:hypothetical protein